MQYKTRQDNTIQDKTRQSKTIQYSETQHNNTFIICRIHAFLGMVKGGQGAARTDMPLRSACSVKPLGSHLATDRLKLSLRLVMCF